MNFFRVVRCFSTEAKSKSLSFVPQLPKIGDLLKLYHVRALNQLSQNFILNPAILESLASAVGSNDDLDDQLIIEIGPGKPKYIKK